MASVDLAALFVHDAVDPSDYVSLRYASLTETTAKDIEVRPYAGGRLRIISRPTTRATYDVVTSMVDYATIDDLRSRAGQLVMVRDQRGRLIYGTYASLQVSERVRPTDQARASFTLTTVSFTETA